MRTRRKFWVVLVVILLSAFGSPVHAGKLLAGAARISITPTPDEFPYTAPRERSFVGVHDEVYVRALVLDDGNQRVALVSVDVTDIPQPAATVKEIAAELAVPQSNILVVATHTHNVFLISYKGGEPNETQRKEIERIQQAAVTAVHQAKLQLQPARIAFARGEAWVNANGGSYVKPVTGDFAGEDDLYFPKLPSDKSLDVVKLESLKGDPLALLVNYSTHGEVMFRSVTKDNGYEVSGDLPGAAAHLLEGNPAAAPVVLFTSGAEGDQLPLFKSLQAAGKLSEVDEGASGWALLDVQARRLAGSVLDTIAKMRSGVSDVQLSAAAGTVNCPGKSTIGGPSHDNGDNAGLHHEGGSNDGHKSDNADSVAPPAIIPIAIIRINDIALAGVGGDVANEIGQHFKKASPIANTTFISMMAGDIGYILTDAIYEDHSLGENHGVGKSPVKPGCAEPAIINGLLGLLSAKASN